MTGFSMWTARLPTLEVDLFVREPFDFAEAKARAMDANLGSARAWIASISDLIEMKRQAGRPKDLDDIRSLEALRDDD